MQESKYCEDIVPLITALLTSRGHTYEHDRLGHFETTVPADVFFGLSNNFPAARFFGLQFKAPRQPAEGVTWDLTDTLGQYETLPSCWSDVIWYCLLCLHQVLFDEGVAGPNAGFLEQAYQGRKKVYFLEHLGLTHNFEHMAEAHVIRSLLGMRRR